MIKLINGNFFDSKCDVLVNAVNCHGVMGGGIALEFKRRMPPDYFRAYIHACDIGLLKLGQVHIYGPLKPGTTYWSFENKYIVNFPTKDHYRNDSKIEYITEGLESLIIWLEDQKIKSIAMPALGCGLGRLKFEDVLKEIEKAFDGKDIEVEVYLPR